MAIIEESKKWSKERCRQELLEMVKDWNEFERFLIAELGMEQYFGLCKDFAQQKAIDMMKKWGMTQAEIDEFMEEMDGDHDDRPKN